MSTVGSNSKELRKWCKDCIYSVDCQCTSCFYGCICSVDCQCYYCLDDCSRKTNECENQAEMSSDDHAVAALLKVENSSETNSEYNENKVFDECPQLVESEIFVELHSITNTNTMEAEVMNSHTDSRPSVLVVEDLIPKLVGLNDLFGAYNVTIKLESTPLSISIKLLSFPFKGKGSKLEMEYGNKLFDIKSERDILTTFCIPHTIAGSLPHALDLYNCNWVDIGQVFWACCGRVKSSVYSFHRVLLDGYSIGFPIMSVDDASYVFELFAMTTTHKVFAAMSDR